MILKIGAPKEEPHATALIPEGSGPQCQYLPFPACRRVRSCSNQIHSCTGCVLDQTGNLEPQSGLPRLCRSANEEYVPAQRNGLNRVFSHLVGRK